MHELIAHEHYQNTTSTAATRTTGPAATPSPTVPSPHSERYHPLHRTSSNPITNRAPLHHTTTQNVRVGYLESCLGLTKLLTALPMGDLSDKYGRTPAARTGTFAYTLASIMTVS